jgi:hypothetical protein
VTVTEKLQLKPGQQLALLGLPEQVDLDVPAGADPVSADAVIAFVTMAADLAEAPAQAAIAAARRDALAWIAYPKAGQLGTDLNRDSLVAQAAGWAVQPVRQVAIDSTWSALRLRPA